MSLTQIDELIAQFDRFDGNYRRQELEEALTLQAEITPRLIAVLEDITDDPVRYIKEDHFANTYAVALLAHFQEPSAHLPIIRAFCIPDNEREELWGDMVSETLPALLVRTCGGDFSTIRALILNRNVYEFTRSAAISALVYGVVQGQQDRDEVIRFLAGLLTGDEAEDGSYFWSAVVSALTDLYPADVMDVIRRAYDHGLVDLMHIGLDDVEREMRLGMDVALSTLGSKVDYRIPSGVHGYISWFGCFKDGCASLQVPKYSGAISPVKVQQNRKKKTRSKNKQAKKSRKKNRR